MDSKESRDIKQIIKICWPYVILTAIFAMLVHLFYAQAVGRYHSDLPAHIASALNADSSAYTIIKPIFKALYLVSGYKGIAVFLAVVVIATIEITYRIFKYLLPGENRSLLYFYSFIANFVIAIYIPYISKYLNVGVQEASEWHNSTYTCMKLVGLFAFLLYLKMDEEYLEKIQLKKWIVFTIALIIVNAIKPSFILAFSPAMLVIFVIDLFKTRGKGLKNIIIFGMAVLVSLTVIVYQYKVLYVDDSNSGLAFGLGTVLRHYSDHPVMSVIQSIAFPLYVLLNNLKEFKKDRKYRFSWIVCIIAFLQYFFLQETGTRMYDGNFDWGYSFALMIIFIISIYMLHKNYKADKKTPAKKVYLIGGYILLALHAVTGIYYFCSMLRGGDYF